MAVNGVLEAAHFIEQAAITVRELCLQKGQDLPDIPRVYAGL